MTANPDALDWRAAAACGDVDPELFFPAAASGVTYALQVAEAKRVCAGCPVRAECLAYALDHLPDGVAGGLNAAERRALRTSTTHVPSPEAARLDAGLHPQASRREVAEAGWVLLAAGRSRTEVAARCQVSVRTVDRWRSRGSCTTAVSHGMTSRQISSTRDRIAERSESR